MCGFNMHFNLNVVKLGIEIRVDILSYIIKGSNMLGELVRKHAHIWYLRKIVA